MGDKNPNKLMKKKKIVDRVDAQSTPVIETVAAKKPKK